jgi:2-methylcitrate dehydratase
MTIAQEMAAFISRVTFDTLSDSAQIQLKIRVLDALGCAIGALGSSVTESIREQIEEFGGAALCTTIGGRRTAPDRAAFYNSALIRYLDFNDSYLAKGETCHPSDNIGAVLAACEYANGSGRDFLTALAIAYQVQCRLSDVAPVRDKGFDHTTQGSYAVAAGVAKALRLDELQAAHALAICGTAFNALRVTRTGVLSNWKGLAYPNTAFGCIHAAFLAMRGITGPLEVFEGNKGFMDSIAGPFEIDWSREDLERVTRTIVKRYNAEIHSQSAIDGILELKQECNFTATEVERIDIEVFDVAYKIIGGGEEGDKSIIRTKEAADHSLPYLIAVALLDGAVTPAQYSPDRIRRADVQAMLCKIRIQPSEEFSGRFPEEMPCRLIVYLDGGRKLVKEKHDYEGFVSRPMRWETVVRKFQLLTEPFTTESLRQRTVDTVADLEGTQINRLADLLQKVMSSTQATEKGVLQHGPI